MIWTFDHVKNVPGTHRAKRSIRPAHTQSALYFSNWSSVTMFLLAECETSRRACGFSDSASKVTDATSVSWSVGRVVMPSAPATAVHRGRLPRCTHRGLRRVLRAIRSCGFPLWKSNFLCFSYRCPLRCPIRVAVEVRICWTKSPEDREVVRRRFHDPTGAEL